MDNIVVFSKSPADPIKQVWSVIGLLYEAGVKLKLKNCKFVADIIDYLSHVTRPSYLKIAEHRTDAVGKLEQPTTQTELRSFLGLCNVFKRFVSSFARLAAALKNKLRKDQQKQFGLLEERESVSVASLKDVFISSPALALPRAKGR